MLLRHGKERLGVEQWSDIGDALLARAQRLRSAWNPDVSRINEQRWCETCTILRDLGAEIQLVESTLRPDNGELSSGRQRTRYASSGLVGATLWEAPPSAFAAWLPLLRFGELVQLGQQTTVGMGRFRVAG